MLIIHKHSFVKETSTNRVKLSQKLICGGVWNNMCHLHMAMWTLNMSIMVLIYTLAMPQPCYQFICKTPSQSWKPPVYSCAVFEGSRTTPLCEAMLEGKNVSHVPINVFIAGIPWRTHPCKTLPPTLHMRLDNCAKENLVSLCVVLLVFACGKSMTLMHHLVVDIHLHA